jgi:hypothetical protein
MMRMVAVLSKIPEEKNEGASDFAVISTDLAVDRSARRGIPISW